MPKALSLCGDYLSALGDFKVVHGHLLMVAISSLLFSCPQKSCGLKPQSTFRESVALFSTLVESQALILLSDTVHDSQVFKLSSSSNSTITPMMDSFNKLNLALRKVLEEAGNFATEVHHIIFTLLSACIIMLVHCSWIKFIKTLQTKRYQILMEY